MVNLFSLTKKHTYLKKTLFCFAVFLFQLLLVSCGKGNQEQDLASNSPAQECDGSCVNANSFLSTSDVSEIISLAISEAELRNAPATIGKVSGGSK